MKDDYTYCEWGAERGPSPDGLPAACGRLVDDLDLIQLTRLRFHKVYCPEHFKDALVHRHKIT